MALPMFNNDNNDKELEFKCRRFTEGISESLHLLSNDPSLALYRIQEHVRKSLPQLVQRRLEVCKLQQSIQGACFDVENAIGVVQNMKASMPTFQNIYELLRSTMYYKQQLDYEKSRRDRAKQMMIHSISKDSIAQELRKTKSMGHIGSKTDLMSESVMTRSTVSTPCSEYPDFQNINDLDNELLLNALKEQENRSANEEDEDRSSTTTSGADSHVSEQDGVFDEIEQNAGNQQQEARPTKSSRKRTSAVNSDIAAQDDKKKE